MERKSFILDKLVRHKTVKKIEDQGGILQSRILTNDEEFLEAVTQKIVEELHEVFQSKTKSELIEELADLQEALDTFKKLVKISDSDIKTAQEKKSEESGNFEKRLYIDSVDLPESAPMYHYCLKNSHKYPEVGEDYGADEELDFGFEEDDEEFE